MAYQQAAGGERRPMRFLERAIGEYRDGDRTRGRLALDPCGGLRGELPLHGAHLQAVDGRDRVQPVRQGEGVGECRRDLDRGVMHEVELLAVGIPRPVRPDRGALTRPVGDGACVFA